MTHFHLSDFETNLAFWKAYDIRKRIAQVLRKKLQIFSKQPVKGNLHIFSFAWLKIRLFKFCKTFCIFEMALSRAFQKCIIFHFLGNFFANIFTILLDFAIKNSIFANLQVFFADSKSRAQELSNDASFVIFGHKTWDLEGGGSNRPPQHILVFKYPSRDGV